MYHRVLVTGANGLVGQEVARRLSGKVDVDLLVTARDASSRVEGLQGGYHRLDLLDREGLERLVADFAPTSIIHCAAASQVDWCEDHREKAWQINVDVPARLAKLAADEGAQLILLSTDFVFDGEQGPYEERDRPNPINYYGKTKLAAENAIRSCGLDRWAIARTVLVYGDGTSLSRPNIFTWARSKLHAGAHINVVADQFRTPTFVGDLAWGLEALVRKRASGIYHLSGQEWMSVRDFVVQMAELGGFDVDAIGFATRASLIENGTRPLKTGFITLKAQVDLGYRPQETRVHLARLLNEG